MKNLKMFILFVLCFFLFTLGVQSQVFDFESGAIPEGWTKSAKVIIVDDIVRFPGRYSCRLMNFDDSLTTNLLTDISVINFWVRTVQPNDNFTLSIETSSDGNTWGPHTTIEYNGGSLSAGLDQPTLFSSRVITINISGDIYIRWRISRYAKGEFYLDDIKFEKLNDEQKKLLEKEETTRKKREEMTLIIEDVFMKTNFNTAKTQFNDVGVIYLEKIKVLAILNDKIVNLNLLASTAVVLNERNQMANPISYDFFKVYADNLEKILPPVKKNRLKDILGGIGKVFGKIVQFTSSFSLQGLINDFKNLFADGYSPENLEKTKLKSEEKTKKINEGPQQYDKIKNILDAFLEESERVGKINDALIKLEQKTVVLRQEMDTILHDQLAFMGINPTYDQFTKIYQRDETTINKLIDEVNSFITNKLGSNQNFKGLTSDHRRFFRDIETCFQQVDELKSKYSTLTNEILGWYKDSQQDLNRTDNPLFKIFNEEDKKKWEDKVSDQKGRLESLIGDFERQYKNIWKK